MGGEYGLLHTILIGVHIGEKGKMFKICIYCQKYDGQPTNIINYNVFVSNYVCDMCLEKKLKEWGFEKDISPIQGSIQYIQSIDSTFDSTQPLVVVADRSPLIDVIRVCDNKVARIFKLYKNQENTHIKSLLKQISFGKKGEPQATQVSVIWYQKFLLEWSMYRKGQQNKK